MYTLRHNFTIACIALTCLLCAPGAEAQQSPEVLLKKAEQQYEQLEYAEALKTLIKVHSASGATKIQRARAYLYMGVCFTALGKANDAILAFIEVLKRRPNFRMPGAVSPSIRAMFNAALKRLKLPVAPSKTQASPQSDVDVEVTARVPPSVNAGAAIPIKIEVDDPKKIVDSLVIRWRRHKTADYSTIRLKYKKGTKELRAGIPAAALGEKTGKILFYVEARDSYGRRVASSGTEDDPREVLLRQPEGKLSTLSWWLIGAGGAAAVAGGIIAAILLTRGAKADTGPGPGLVDLTVVLR